MVPFLRKNTPLRLRQTIGPWLGYLAYFWRTRIRGRTWEPHVLTIKETIERIRTEECSFIRFGDGELSLMSGSDLGFQRHDPQLAKRLREIIRSEHETLLIGIPAIFGRLEHLAKTGFWFEIHHLFRYSSVWKELVRPDRQYGDAFMTRPYLSYSDRSVAGEIYRAIKSLWSGRDIILIEGEKSRLGVGNDLFSDARSVQRILGPSEDAYAKADGIIDAVADLPTDRLIMLSLGPAAKVIGYELFCRGYRVLDVGHVDMEYEMFLRGSERLVPVRYKYFNEINVRDPEDCDDASYRSEIFARFL